MAATGKAGRPNPFQGKLFLTQRQVADFMGISKTRVYQIENRALRKIRDAIVREAAMERLSVRDWLYEER